MPTPPTCAATSARTLYLGRETGEAQTGEAQTGEVETGEAETGEVETGEAETGEVETGEAETGEVETEHTGVSPVHCRPADTLWRQKGELQQRGNVGYVHHSVGESISSGRREGEMREMNLCDVYLRPGPRRDGWGRDGLPVQMVMQLVVVSGMSWTAYFLIQCQKKSLRKMSRNTDVFLSL